MCGQLVMEVNTLTPVLLMATHLTFILLGLVQLTRGEDRLTMMKIVPQTWQSHSVTTLAWEVGTIIQSNCHSSMKLYSTVAI